MEINVANAYGNRFWGGYPDSGTPSKFNAESLKINLSSMNFQSEKLMEIRKDSGAGGDAEHVAAKRATSQECGSYLEALLPA